MKRGAFFNMREAAAAMDRLPKMTEREWREAVERTDQEWSRVRLPAGWREQDFRGTVTEGARGAVHGKASVIFSCGRYPIGQPGGAWWLHVSIAHPERLPSYMDLVELHRVFVGEDRKAIQVFAPKSEHVSIHSRALHLWACLEPAGDGLPNFGEFGTI